MTIQSSALKLNNAIEYALYTQTHKNLYISTYILKNRLE